jgi:NAD(P)-dependent dehydrogenase (short-subunit alcohol dehydrogenase family)
MTALTFADQHFIITGAGTGIGRAIAVRLASLGASVSLLGRRAEPLEETARLVRSHGTKCHVETCDVRDRAQVDAAFLRSAEALGAFSGLVANAGIGGENRAGPGDRFDDIVTTNLIGTYSCLRAAEQHMAASKQDRHIVVIASILARIGVAGYTGYCASKAGLLGLVRSAAMELAPKQIMVNAICPGWVSTDMAWQGIDGFAGATGQTRDQAFAEAMKAVPLGRMSEPEDIAGLVAFLLSPQARGITGQSIDMNNGAWMG